VASIGKKELHWGVVRCQAIVYVLNLVEDEALNSLGMRPLEKLFQRRR